MLRIRSIIFGITAHFLAIEQEEVAAQHGTDTLQQYRVNAFSLEDIVYVGAVTWEPFGQPRHAVSLPAQLRFDFFTYVYRHCSTNIDRNGSLVATIQVTHERGSQVGYLTIHLPHPVPFSTGRESSRKGIVHPLRTTLLKKVFYL